MGPLTIGRVFRRAGSWVEAGGATGHRILLSRGHKGGPVLQPQRKPHQLVIMAQLENI